jgi:hypothetical protein
MATNESVPHKSNFFVVAMSHFYWPITKKIESMEVPPQYKILLIGEVFPPLAQLYR